MNDYCAFAAPAVYDVVICRFPYVGADGVAHSEPRPAVVLMVHPRKSGQIHHDVTVVEASSRVWSHSPDDYYILRKDHSPVEFEQTGLSKDTKLKVSQIVTLPYTEGFFKVPKELEFGANPKIGHLTARMIEGMVKALRAWVASPRNPRNRGRIRRI